MPYLNILRRLAENQQFSELRAEALACWEEGGDVRALPLLALALAQLGERRQALACYEQGRKKMAELDLAARVDLAGVDCVLLRLRQAEALLQGVLQAEPDHALALARLAWCRLQQGDLEAALRFYRRSSALEPWRLPVWLALVRLHLQKEEAEAAQAPLERAITCLEERQEELPGSVIDLFTAQLRSLQLHIWVVDGQLARAEEWLASRRADLPEDVWVSLVTGYAVLLAGHDQHSQAEEALRNGLKHYPVNLALLLQLAELAQAQGHFLQAVRALQRAIDLESENPALWSRLAGASLHRFDRQARRAAEKGVALAQALAGDDKETSARDIRLLLAQARNALALVEGQEENFGRAEELFGQVLAENPFFVPSLQGLAQLYMQQGRIDEALGLYEQLKRVDPLQAQAALINARHFPGDEESLAKMGRAAARPSLEGRVRSGLFFQLAAAWDKRQEYDKAFVCARKANEASGRHLSYDPKKHRTSCARLRHAFSPELYQHRPGSGDPSSLPVYVLGMPRSGTTLVEQIIAGHSEIFGAGELGIIPQRIAGLNRWERHVGSGRRYPDCIDDLSPAISQGIAQGIISELKELAAQEKPAASHVVDKLPHNFENIGFIKFLLPGAKIISVGRDPRDIAISNYFTDYQAKHGGMGFAYDLNDIGQQLADHNLLMQHWHKLFPGQIMEISYEEVVDDLEGSARRLLAYIGVEWQGQVLKFNELKRPVKTASVWQVRQPIYKSAKARWRHYREYLAPLTRGTNAKIRWQPIADMLTLPEPGLLQAGVELYHGGDLDGAELKFKKMLHHNPDHAACNYMVGLVYCSKGHVADAVPLMEKAVAKCPWQKEWRQNLAKAYNEIGKGEVAAKLFTRRAGSGRGAAAADNEPLAHGDNSYLAPGDNFADY
ncbi:MAG: sulfotransferase [Thermodesulfobacteriota bacterium]